MPPRLTVCIPTHHGRAEPLRVALGSIAAQLECLPPGTVNVVVSDNGSRDATREVVGEFQRSWPGVLAYRRFEANEGFRANLLAAVRPATGEYCWLFSSDDAVAPGGLERLIKLLDQYPGVAGLTTHPVAYDLQRGVPAPPFYPDLLPAEPGVVHGWRTMHDVVVGCAALMGVLSAQVVRREAWVEVVRDGAALESYTLFPHYHAVLRIALREPTWVWDPGPTLLLRSEVGNSVVGDLGGNLTRYHVETTAETVTLWRDVLGDGPMTRLLMAKTRRAIFTPRALVFYKGQPTQRTADDMLLLRRCVGWFWRLPSFWASVPVLLLPHSAARVLLRAVAAARGLRARQPRWS